MAVVNKHRKIYNGNGQRTLQKYVKEAGKECSKKLSETFNKLCQNENAMFI